MEDDKVNQLMRSLGFMAVALSVLGLVIWTFFIKSGEKKVKIKIPTALQQKTSVQPKTVIGQSGNTNNPVIEARALPKDMPKIEVITNLDQTFKEYTLEATITFTDEISVKEAIEDLRKMLSMVATSPKIKEVKISNASAVDCLRGEKKSYKIQQKIK